MLITFSSSERSIPSTSSRSCGMTWLKAQSKGRIYICQQVTKSFGALKHSAKLSRLFSNPFPGKIFNTPDMSTDVYEGARIDYKGEDVTVDNILNVLAGNKDNVTGGNGRVIER